MPFQKGQSGNPKGRRAEKPFKDALNIELAAAGNDQKALRKIASRLIEMAIEGDIRAIKEIADRLDGKPVQQVQNEHSGVDSDAIVFQTIYEQAPNDPTH